MSATAKNYAVLVDFLGKVLGPHYEIVFYDLSSGKYEISAIANGQLSGRAVGAPLTDLALQFIIGKTYKETDYKTNYCGMKKDKHFRSSTMFVKNEKDELVGMLCINCNSSRASELVEGLCSLLQLDMLPSGAEGRGSESAAAAAAPDTIERFSGSVAHLVASVLEQTLPDPNIQRERLTQEEKLRIVDTLNKKGIFLIKGAVIETAAQLCSSEASIYRYLSKLNRKK